jgi:hypothetical protein
MKQGSADYPFAEDLDEPADGEREEETDDRLRSGDEQESTGGSSTEDDTGDNSTDNSKTLPYIYARDSVKDGRQQRPIFLRDEIEDGIPALVSELESSLGEDVYRTDVLEAAVVVAQRNPELVEEALEEWGYGWQ